MAPKKWWKILRKNSRPPRWHSSVRAPLAQSVERRYFIPIFKGLSHLCVAETPFFHRAESKETWKFGVDYRDQERITMSGKGKAKHSKKFGRTFKMTAKNKRTKLSSSQDSQFGRAFDFWSNAQRLKSLVGRKKLLFLKNRKQEKTRNLRWIMRPRKNHEEPQKFRSRKNLWDRSNWKQETMWHANFRAPLADSIERWSFKPYFKGSSLFCAAKNPFFTELKARKHRNSE